MNPENIYFSEYEEKTFLEAKSKVTDFPDGFYVGEFIGARMDLVKGKRYLILNYSVISPAKFSGGEKSHFINLDNPDFYWLVKKDVSKFDIVEGVRLSELDLALQARIGKVVEFELKTKTEGGFQNLILVNVYDKPISSSLPKPSLDNDEPF